MWRYLPIVNREFCWHCCFMRSLTLLNIFTSKIKRVWRLPILLLRILLAAVDRQFEDRALSFQWCQDIPGEGYPIHPFGLSSLPFSPIQTGSAVSTTTYMDGHVQEAAEERTWAWRKGIKMYTAKKKIQKDKGVEPSEFKDTIARNLIAAVAAPSVPAFGAPQIHLLDQ